ncbi:MAG: AMP-binding protein [Burkholderiales bacterium]
MYGLAHVLVGVRDRIPQYGKLEDRGFKTIAYRGGPTCAAGIVRALQVTGRRVFQTCGQGESPMTTTALPRPPKRLSAPSPRGSHRFVRATKCVVVELRVATAEGRPLPPGEVGEVLVRGDPVTKGYWNNALAKAKTLRDGWLQTGDTGRPDEDGFLTLGDRSKDLIIPRLPRYEPL